MNGNRPVVVDICRRLDRLPLAIELAAARIKLLSETALLARLDERLTLLTGGARDLEPRQRTLRAAIDWSYELLSLDEQRLFRRLAVFAGGRTLEAIESVCNAEGNLDVFETVASLVDKSLLRAAETGDGEPRFVMLETIHEYALERLTGSGELDDLRNRHAGFFLRLSERAGEEIRGADEASWLARLDDERFNLHAALDWFTAAGATEQALRLANGAARFWEARGHVTPLRAWYASVLADAAAVPDDVRAEALYVAGRFALVQDDHADGERLLQRSAEAAAVGGDHRCESLALGLLSWTAAADEDLAKATELGERAVSVARQTGDVRTLSGALNALAQTVEAAGDLTRARQLTLESLDLRRSLGDRGNIANALLSLGWIVYGEGDTNSAREHLREAVDLAEELGDSLQLAWCRSSLAHFELKAGRIAEARVLALDAVTPARDLGDKRTVANTLMVLAACAVADNHPRDCAVLWSAAAEIGAEAADDLEEFRARAEQELGPAEYEESVAVGARLGLDGAVEYALAHA